MGDSIEFKNGVTVDRAAHQSETADAAEGRTSTSTGTALMPRPGASLVGAVPPMPVGFDNRPGARPESVWGPRSAHRRTLVVVVVAALVAAIATGAAVGAAASGRGTGSGTPAQGSSRGALAAAAAGTAAAPTVAFTLQATQATAAATTTLVTGSGAVDLARGVGRMTAAVPELSGVVGSGGDSASLVTDGRAVYVGVPALAQLTGRIWLRATLPTDAVTGGTASAILATLSDPTRLVGLLGSLGGTVTDLGPVVLDGTSATEYRTTITLAALASRASHGSSSRISSLGAATARILSRLGNVSVPVTAWVGPDGRLRQLSVSLLLSRASLAGLLGDAVSGSLGTPPATLSATSTTITVGFSHYGEPVDASVPPASEVTDLGSILSSVQGGLPRVAHDLSGLAARL